MAEKQPIDLGEKLDKISGFWAPRVVADYNGNEVFVVKMQGAFNWHSHPDTDDFFLVLKGRLRIEMRDGNVVLNPGQLFVVPKGVEHRPVAETDEVHALLIEPAGTPNTVDPATAAEKKRI